MTTGFRLVLVILLVLCGTTFTGGQNLLNGPESISFDSLRNRYLVSCYQSGRIVQVDTAGNQSIYLSGFDHCFGNCMRGDTLFVCDGTSVWGFDLATNDTVMHVILPPYGVNFDGITTDTSGFLYVVYTGGMLGKINIAQGTYSLFVPGGLGNFAQDVTFDARHNRLLVVGWSLPAPIRGINLPDSALTDLVTPPMGNFDGITIDHVGNVYLSSHTGSNGIWRYGPDLRNPPELISSGYNQPAGLDFNRRDCRLAVPIFGENRMVIFPLEFHARLEECILDDAAGGDGNGTFEPGETVDLTVSVINYENTTVTDVTVTIVFDDAAVQIDDGSAYLGNIESIDTAVNTADPITFTVPDPYGPRIDSLFVVLSYNGGSLVDTTVLDVSLGTPRILLVDDDDGDTLDVFYRECLMDERIPYAIWTAPPVPDASDLVGYDLVVWFTGDYRAAFDAPRIAAAQGLLDGGGKLFLTGQGIGQLLDLLDRDFLNTYLKSEYHETQAHPFIAAEPGGLVLAFGDTVYAAGAGGADNQTDQDFMGAVNGGVGEMKYVGTSDLAAVSYAGDYRLLFFGFGFEAIVNGNPRWTDRPAVFDDILNFFTYTRPAPPPEVESVLIQPGDPTHMLEHTPTMSWIFSDPGPASQVYYWVQVGADTGWSTAELWDSGPVSSASTQAAYDGSTLQDGVTYHARIRVNNGSMWSAWKSVQFRINSVPVPSGLVPNNLQEVNVDSLKLAHTNMADTEGDAITYAYEIYDDAGLTMLMASAEAIPAGPGPTMTWEPPAELQAGNDYYWRVRGNDGYENGAWSAPASFTLIQSYICGDANGDASVNVGDAVFLISYVFKGGAAPDPVCAGDANGDGGTNVGDAVYMISYVFKGGAPPVTTCCR